MKVHVIVSYLGDKCTVEEVFLSRAAAERRAKRLAARSKEFEFEEHTYHVISKSVRDMRHIPVRAILEV